MDGWMIGQMDKDRSLRLDAPFSSRINQSLETPEMN